MRKILFLLLISITTYSQSLTVIDNLATIKSGSGDSSIVSKYKLSYSYNSGFLSRERLKIFNSDNPKIIYFKGDASEISVNSSTGLASIDSLNSLIIETTGADGITPDTTLIYDRFTDISDSLSTAYHTLEKNAADYGFLPSASAEANAIALQNALNGGGTIRVTEKGVYSLCNTITIPSNASLIFSDSVYISKSANLSGDFATYVFINDGAFSKTFNENILIKGLKLRTNGEGKGDDISEIYGLRGQISFFYVKNLRIEDFELLDGEASTYVIHIARFENVRINNIRVEGLKDAVHASVGKGLKISNGYFKTYDDPIALNAHDYVDGTPELGSIEDVVIENCYDLDDASGTTGYFCRILAGSWVDWYSGMSIKRGDAIVTGGKLYRSRNSADGTIYTSNTAPTHTSGEVTIDGIKWFFVQDSAIVYKSEVKNVMFRDIFLEKTRPSYFSIHLDNDNYSRSYYPDSPVPTVSNIVFDNVIMKNDSSSTFLSAKANVKGISLNNCEIRNAKIRSLYLGTSGLVYDDIYLNLNNTTFSGSGMQTWIEGQGGKNTYINEHNSIYLDSTYVQTNIGNIFYNEQGHYHSNLSDLENLESKFDTPQNLTQYSVPYWDGDEFRNFSMSINSSGRLNHLYLQNNKGIYGRNVANTTDYRILHFSSDENVYINHNSLSNSLYFATSDEDRMVINPSGQIGINATSVVSSAKVQINSTTQGLLPPRMTTAQRTAISSPAVGLQVYDTEEGMPYWYTTEYGWVNPVNSFTGWADYTDTTYTVSSPFSLTGGVKYTLYNHADIIRDSQLPSDIDSVYSRSDSTILGFNGDGWNILIEFKIKPTTATVTRLTVTIDIGGAVGEIYPRDLVLSKGNGEEHYYVSSFAAYTLDTWEANGAKVKVQTNAAAEIYDVRYVLTRTHKAR